MIPADLALALLINRTATAYNAGAPTYISYTEHLHVSSPTINRTQEIDRSVVVRQADNYAVMHDLPAGAQRTGQAFPIIPYFDPFSSYGFNWYANLKFIAITLDRGDTYVYPIPAPDPSVDVVVPYNSYWAARYAADSTDAVLHLQLSPTSRWPRDAYYVSDIVVDPQSQLPSHIELRTSDDDSMIALDYKMIDNHWTIVHGLFTATEHVAIIASFKVTADITYSDITFPTTPPDPLLAGTPAPTPTP